MKYIKLPDGYASKISTRLSRDEATIRGIKSHDCYVLMQRILPVIFCRFLDEDILEVVYKLSCFFKALTTRKLQVDLLKSMQRSIAIMLYMLEMIFPLAFFNIMIHLAIQLPREAFKCGLVSVDVPTGEILGIS